MLRRVLLGLTAAILTAGFIAPPAMATHTWDAEGASKLWAEIVPRAWANWDPDSAPDSDDIVFDNRMAGGAGDTNILDRDYTVTSITVEKMFLGPRHRTNLDGHTLTSGPVQVGYDRDNGYITVMSDSEYADGMFWVGTQVPMDVGHDWDDTADYEGSLHVTDVIYKAFLSSLSVGRGIRASGDAQFTALKAGSEVHVGTDVENAGDLLLIGVRDYAGGDGGATGSLFQSHGTFDAHVNDLYVGSYRAGKNDATDACVGTMTLTNISGDVTLDATRFYIGSESASILTKGNVTVNTNHSFYSTVEEDLRIANTAAAQNGSAVTQSSLDLTGVSGWVDLRVKKSLIIGKGGQAEAWLDVGSSPANNVEIGTQPDEDGMYVGVRDMAGDYEVLAQGQYEQDGGRFVAKGKELFIGVCTEGRDDNDNGAMGYVELTNMNNGVTMNGEKLYIGHCYDGPDADTSRCSGTLIIAGETNVSSVIEHNLVVGRGNSGALNIAQDGSSLSGTLDLSGVAGPGANVMLAVWDKVFVGVGKDAYGTVSLPDESNVWIGNGGDEDALNIGVRTDFDDDAIPAKGSFVQAGGTFDAHVNQLVVGHSDHGDPGSKGTGLLDLKNVTLAGNGVKVKDTFCIGYETGDRAAEGLVMLGAGTDNTEEWEVTASTKWLIVGTDDGGEGVLELYGTHFAVDRTSGIGVSVGVGDEVKLFYDPVPFDPIETWLRVPITFDDELQDLVDADRIQGYVDGVQQDVWMTHTFGVYTDDGYAYAAFGAPHDPFWVIPEPAGLGLIGAALLARRRRR